MIVVTGASGFIGRHLVARLLRDGQVVRCLVPPGRGHELDSSTIPDVVSGSLLNEEQIFKVLTGAHTVIHLDSAQWWGRSRDLERIEVFGTRNLVAAARSARVGRIIVLSQLGASIASAYALLSIKGQVEEIVRTSGLAYTIIRSGVVFGEDDAFINHIAMILRLTPLVFLMPGYGEVVLHPIYIDDLIEVLVRSLELVSSIDSTVEIGGQEYITVEDLIATIMRVTGQYRTVLPVPPYLLRSLVGVYSRIFPRSLMTPQWLDILAANRTAPLGNIFNNFGIQPRRLEDALLTYMPDKNYLRAGLRYTLRRRPRSA
jgi:uncharacterized protein YbjT (DUF2867 family)